MFVLFGPHEVHVVKCHMCKNKNHNRNIFTFNLSTDKVNDKVNDK